MKSQLQMFRESDPGRRYSTLFRAAEEMQLTKADIEALIAKRPEVYWPLKYWKGAK